MCVHVHVCVVLCCVVLCCVVLCCVVSVSQTLAGEEGGGLRVIINGTTFHAVCFDVTPFTRQCEK